MNKLVQKNPVQKFKQGRKIVKAYNGITFHKKNDFLVVNSPGKESVWVNMNYRTGRMFANKVLKPYIINSLSKFNKYKVKSDTTPTTNQVTGTRTKAVTTTTPVPTYYATRAYRGKIPVAGLNSREAVKAYQRDVLGMTGRDLDGIWGDNTQRAYLALLKPKVKFVPGVSSEKEDVAILNNIPSQITIDPNFVSDIINNEENNRTRLYEALNDPDIEILPSAKQGAKLVSKNPVKRFKKNKTINFMKGLH